MEHLNFLFSLKLERVVDSRYSDSLDNETYKNEVKKIQEFLSTEQGRSYADKATATHLIYLLNVSDQFDNPFCERIVHIANKLFFSSENSLDQGVKTVSEGHLIDFLYSSKKLGQSFLQKACQATLRVFSHSLLISLINQKKITLQDLALSEEELLQMAPHLTHIHLSGNHNIYSEKFIYEFLSKATCAEELYLTQSLVTDEALFALPNKERIKKLCVNHCKHITQLPSFANCTHCYCTHCNSLRAIGNLPSCKVLSCLKCTNLVSIGDIPTCERLHYTFCSLLSSVGTLSSELKLAADYTCHAFRWGSIKKLNEELIEATERKKESVKENKLFFSSQWGRLCLQRASCEETQNLLQVLHRVDPSLLDYVKEAAAPSKDTIALATWINKKELSLTSLSLSEDNMLALAPHLTYLELAHVDRTTYSKGFLFKLLSKASSVTHLHLTACSITDEEILSLPHKEKINKLILSSCTTLKHLPSFQECTALRCLNCTSLLSIGDFPRCRELWCSGCVALVFIGMITDCTYLDCTNCSALLLIGDIHYVIEMQYASSLRRTNCPFFATFLPQKKFIVEIHKIKRQVPELLLSLLDIYQTIRNFPGVLYKQNGKGLSAVDTGGLTRDFLGKLFTHAFDEDNPQKLAFKVDNHGMKLLKQTTDEEKPLLQSVARLLALSWKGESQVTIGPIFPSFFFTCLQRGNQELFYCLHQGIDPRVLTLAGAKDGDPILQNLEVQTIAGFLMDTSYGKEAGYFTHQEHRSLLKEFITSKLSQDPYVRAFTTILKEMNVFLGNTIWKEVFIKMEPSLIERKIQGSLSRDLLRRSLQWHPQYQEVTEDEKVTYQNYFDRWIEEASETKLKNFIFMATGSPSLHVTTKIKIELEHAFAKKLFGGFVFRTCTKTVELPLEMSYEQFKESLEAVIADVETQQNFNCA